MGISAIGQGITVSAARHAAATVVVFLALFYYLYGPPLTHRLSESAHQQCNALTGHKYRDYRLEWLTTSLTGINTPHWVCVDLSHPGRAIDLGWWAGA